MRWHKDRLFESDPRKLDAESLLELQKLLLSKLLIVNREQRARYRNTIERGADLRAESLDSLHERMTRIDRFNAVVKDELERMMEPRP
jgi:hypothetical protein